VHADHCSSIPKKFSFAIYCSPETFFLMQSIRPDLQLISLEKDKWHTIHEQDIYIFDSNHCIGSIGFICKNNLFWGDGRPFSEQLKTIQLVHKKKFKRVFTDTFLHEFKEPYQLTLYKELPLPEKTTQDVTTILQMYSQKFKKIYICVSHFGTLPYLPKHVSYQCMFGDEKKTNTIPDRLCQLVFDWYRFRSATKSKYILIRKLPKNVQKNHFYIVISARWWLVNDQKIFNPVLTDENVIRVFLCMHASHSETLLLQRLQK
jgi:hypothetical protein